MAEKRATLEIHVQAGASRNEAVGLKDGTLWVRVTAPPFKGKANSALLTLMAQLLSVPKNTVAINQGHTSRHKVIAVRGLGPQDLQERLAQALSAKQPSQE